MTLTPQLFAEAGRALFGEEWQNPTAALLGINPRTVRRIAAAARDGIAYDVNQTLAPLLAQHLADRAIRAEAEAVEARRLVKLLAAD